MGKAPAAFQTDMKQEEIIDTIQRKKLVFTVATGRCGTAYFAEILRLIPGASSYHEPKPEYADVLREVQGAPECARKFLLDRKLPVIAEDENDIYIETSHLFCKGFLDPLLSFGIIPSLLWIKRAHRAVASSLFRGGTIPGRTEKGLQFYLSPEDPDVLPLPDWESLHDYQLCFWYCIEIEKRAEKYRDLYNNNGWRWTETSLVEISTMAGVKRLVSDLDLPRLSLINWIRYFHNRRRRVNPTLKSKEETVLPGNLDVLEKQVLERVEHS